MIRTRIDGEETEIDVPAAQAERIRSLLEQAQQQEQEGTTTREEKAAHAIMDIDREKPVSALARALNAHADLNGDREAPLNAVGLYMLSNGTMLADLVMLMQWLHQQGHLDEEAAERIGLRDGALQELGRILDDLGPLGGPGDLAWELQVRGLERTLQRQLQPLQERGDTELRTRILILLAAGHAGSLEEARQQALQQEDPGPQT